LARLAGEDLRLLDQHEPRLPDLRPGPVPLQHVPHWQLSRRVGQLERPRDRRAPRRRARRDRPGFAPADLLPGAEAALRTGTGVLELFRRARRGGNDQAQGLSVASNHARLRDGPSHTGLACTLRDRLGGAPAAGDASVYGISTGFGALAGTRIPPDQRAHMQHSLVRSHAAGMGPPTPRDVVRAMLLLRAATLARGYSGVRPVVATALL